MEREEELKFAVPSRAWARQRLLACGARLQQEPALEENWVLDDARGSLRERGMLLRLRQWAGACTLTFKGPAQLFGTVKSRQELELPVGDVERAVALFSALGFSVRFRYQKVRETYGLQGAVAAVDHTPMGDFLELEGPAARLPELARQLGLAPEAALTASYLELWRRFCAEHGGSPEAMLLADELASP